MYILNAPAWIAPSGEELGETDVFAGYWAFISRLQ